MGENAYFFDSDVLKKWTSLKKAFIMVGFQALR